MLDDQPASLAGDARLAPDAAERAGRENREPQQQAVARPSRSALPERASRPGPGDATGVARPTVTVETSAVWPALRSAAISAAPEG